MSTTELIARGKRIYEAAVTWFGLDVGASVDVQIEDLPYAGIALTDTTLAVSQRDFTALTEYLNELSHRDVSPVDRPGPWKGEERL